jgi:putative transposase
MKIEKRIKIKETYLKTRAKRKLQECTVFELKVDESKLSNENKNKIRMFFLEAKWLYNHILNQKDIFNFDYKTKRVKVKNKDGEFIDKELSFLTAANRRDVLYGIYRSVNSLSASKKKGRKIGKLKFKSSYNSIELAQYKMTHQITGRNRFRINGIKTSLFVRGLDQITPEYEFANAKLVRKPSGIYIKLTAYKFIGLKEDTKSRGTIKEVGLDYGIKTNITTSDGEKFNISVEETDRLKRLQRRIFKAKKGSNNRWKLRLKLQKEYEKIGLVKKDQANKFVHYLLANYDKVYMQDENISGWKSGLFGRKVQHSCMGTIKEKLKKSPQVVVVVRKEPTTKLCYSCGKINTLSLYDREYRCECGLIEDRDIKAAKTIMYLGQCRLKYIPTERRESKPVKNLTSANPSLGSKFHSTKQEALVEKQG